MAAKRILLADDHVLFNQALAAQLAQWLPGCRCEFVTSLAALRTTKLTEFDLAIVDLSFADGDALAWLTAHAAGRVLIVTAAQEEAVILHAVALEVDGVAHKSDDISVLRHAIDTILSGGHYLSPRIRELQTAIKRRPDALHKILSPRELEVLRLIGRGNTTDEIASTLGIRASSVSDHKKNLMQKLGAATANDLLRCAIERGVARV
ncbi:MAG: response regulator transcription factor [Opitutae bacterium]|nr:response regulator transcription factor [Opitutae bacterium]